MSDTLERLLDAHVQHELSSWQGDALAHTIEQRVTGLFQWFEGVKLDDVVTRAQVAGVIERYVIDLRVSGGITELSGELSRLVLTSHATADARLDHILGPEIYREFADKVLTLESVRRELIAMIAQSSTVRSISARLTARTLLDVLALAVPLPRVRMPRAWTEFSARAGAAVQPAVAQLAETVLARLGERVGERVDERLREALRPEPLRSIVDELWDRVSAMRLSEVFAFIQEQDVEDFVVLIYEFWSRYRKTDFFRRVSTEAIDHFFRKYGQASMATVIDDLGVTRRMVIEEALASLQPMLEHAARSGALEDAIRRRLSAFYRSTAARAALGE